MSIGFYISMFLLVSRKLRLQIREDTEEEQRMLKDGQRESLDRLRQQLKTEKEREEQKLR